MAADLKALLTAQGLEESDIEANRAGRVSQAQIARQQTVRKGGGFSVWSMVVLGIVGGGGIGVWKYATTGDIGVLIFMSLLGLVLAGLPLGIYYGTRFADPAKVGAAKVTLIRNAEVNGFLPAPLRGVYAISLNHQRYSGFASSLWKDQLGPRVNAWVVAEYKIVVAIEPAS